MNATLYVSTARAAAALGVSVTTVKRWADDGILPAHKTAGGHRKLLLADVLRLVNEGDFPRLDLTLLRSAEPAAPAVLRRDLTTALRNGDGPRVTALIQDAFHAGLSIASLGDEVVGPAVNQLGHDWEGGRIGVLHEHRGTQLCAGALYQLKAALTTAPARQRPLAIGGAPEHDHYVLPTLLVQMTLLDLGWDAVNLGPHTPFSSLRQAVRELKPRLIWLAASHLTQPAVFLPEYREFFREAAQADVAVAVGGRALTDEIRRQMPYTSFGDRLEHLAAFTRTLQARPRPPRRGRPPAN